MRKILSLILILFITSTSAFAGEIVKSKLKNGQTVIVKEVKNNPIVMIDTWVKTGSIDENDCNNGVAHFLEHLFFKGSKNYPDNQFDKILESKGASTNAATSKDFTHFHILIPSKDFETALKLHADMLTNPLVPPVELNKERQVVIREIERSNDNPQRILYNNFTKSLYKQHPYRREVLGTKEIIANISRQEIMNFYQKHYAPENMITVIVGDVNAQDANVLVQKYFSNGLKTEKPQKRNYKQDKRPEKQVVVTSQQDINTTYMLMGFKCGQKITDKDSYALDLLATLMGDGRSSVLYKELKDKSRLVQGVSAGHSSSLEDSIFFVSANLNGQNLSKVENKIFDIIKDFQTKNVAPSDLERAKKMIERDTLYARESVSATASEIGYCTLLTGDWNFYNDYLSNIKKVTVEDIKKVAQKYLDKNHAIISVVNPKTQQPQEEETKSCAVEESKTVTVSPEKYYKPKAHDGVVTSTSGNLKKLLIDNDATLLTDIHKNNEIIAMTVKVKGGNYIDKTRGLSSILGNVMLKGTERYPKDDFVRITEENGIKIFTESDKEYFTLTMQCAKPDLPLAIDVLNQVVNHATLSADEIEKAKNDAIYAIKQSRDSATNVAFEEISSALWQNTFYDTTGKLLEKTIPTITPNDVQTRYATLFDPKNTVVAVCGDVTEQEMINLVGDIFNSKNTAKIDYSDYQNLFKPIEKTETIVKNQGNEAAWVVIGWKTDSIVDQKDRAVVRVINAILGSGMSSRLFTEVRAQKGLAYAVASTIPSGVNQGAFMVYIGTDPKKVDSAEEAMLFEVDRLKKEFVSEEELENAKNKVKGSAILAQELNSDKADTMAISEVFGNGYDFYNGRFDELIDEVTLTDIIAVANKYFSKPYVVSKVLPKN